MPGHWHLRIIVIDEPSIMSLCFEWTAHSDDMQVQHDSGRMCRLSNAVQYKQLACLFSRVIEMGKLEEWILKGSQAGSWVPVP
jgi:hypothetical protein